MHLTHVILQRESEGKEYSETIAFLSLTRTLYPGIYMSEQFDACMHFVINDVFSLFLNRAYNNPDQKWYGDDVLGITKYKFLQNMHAGKLHRISCAF